MKHILLLRKAASAAILPFAVWSAQAQTPSGRVDEIARIESVANGTCVFTAQSFDSPFVQGTSVRASLAEGAPLTSCHHDTPLRAADLRGRLVRITGAAVGSDSMVVEQVVTADNCAERFGWDGNLVGIAASELSITTTGGQNITVRFPNDANGNAGDTSSVELRGCGWQVVSWSELKPGDFLHLAVDRYAEPGAEPSLELARVTVECMNIAIDPLSEIGTFDGTLVHIGHDSVTIHDLPNGNRTFPMSAMRAIVGCNGEAITEASLVPESSIRLLAQQRNDVWTVRTVLHIEQCPTVATLDAQIVSGTSQTLDILLPSGRIVRAGVADGTPIVDCAGTSHRPDDSVLGGAQARLMIWTTSMPVSIVRADVGINCPTTVQIRGVLRSMDASHYVFASLDDTTTLSIPRNERLTVVNTDLQPLGTAALQVGTQACVTTATMNIPGDSPNDGTTAASFVTVGGSCITLSPSSDVMRARGTVVNVSTTELRMNTPTGTMTFALAGSTRYLGIAGYEVLKTGSIIEILSFSRRADVTPVADALIAVDAATSVEEVSDATPVLVSPNPASSTITFRNVANGIRRIAIHTITGTQVLAQEFTPVISVDGLPNGPYIVQLHGASGSVATYPFTVVR